MLSLFSVNRDECALACLSHKDCAYFALRDGAEQGECYLKGSGAGVYKGYNPGTLGGDCTVADTANADQTVALRPGPSDIVARYVADGAPCTDDLPAAPHHRLLLHLDATTGVAVGGAGGGVVAWSSKATEAEGIESLAPAGPSAGAGTNNVASSVGGHVTIALSNPTALHSGAAVDLAPGAALGATWPTSPSPGAGGSSGLSIFVVASPAAPSSTGDVNNNSTSSSSSHEDVARVILQSGSCMGGGGNGEASAKEAQEAKEAVGVAAFVLSHTESTIKATFRCGGEHVVVEAMRPVPTVRYQGH